MKRYLIICWTLFFLGVGINHMGQPPEYGITRIDEDFSLPGDPVFWQRLPVLTIDHYRWADNGYSPRVEVRLCYSARNLYVFFKVFEPKIKVRFGEFQDPVYKDSCAEFFIDPFPEKGVGYINIETNAIGTVLIAIGPSRARRTPIPQDDLRGFEIATSVKKPLEGAYGAEFWTLTYKVPLALYEKYYGVKLSPGHLARANFYKCGDETDFPHYGAWSPVLCAEPDFHRPEFFGTLRFL
jgi:hypothetical protein